jgi:hypothetical protein
VLRLIEDDTWGRGLADAAYEMVRTRADRERILGGMEGIYRRLAATAGPRTGLRSR